jgi:hypothetical protein
MRSTTIARAIISAGALSFLAATPAFAAPPSEPSGTITLTNSPPSEVAYSHFADFETVLGGDVSNKASVYVTVLCEQGDTSVYHSSENRGVTFKMEDQGTKELIWNGAEADCEAKLMYRVDKGKSSSFTLLDHVSFKVVPEAPSTIVWA